MTTRSRLRCERRLEAARGYLTLGMAEHALRELEDIEDPSGAEFELHQLRGEACRQTGDWEQALREYRQALVTEANDLTSLLGLAWCYRRSGEVTLALVAMERAYRINPQTAVVLYSMACYHALKANKPLALLWLDRAIRMERAFGRRLADEQDFDPLRNDPDFQFMAQAACT